MRCGARPLSSLLVALWLAGCAPGVSDVERWERAHDLPALLSTVATSPQMEMRNAAAAALGRIKDPTTASALVDALHGSGPDTRGTIENALVAMPDAAVDALLVALPKADGADAQIPLIDLLGRIGDARAAPLLSKKLKTSEPAAVAAAATRALTALDDAGIRAVVDDVRHGELQLYDETTSAFLGDALEKRGPAIRTAWLDAVKAAGNPMIDQLAVALGQASPAADRLAIETLVALGPSVIDPMLSMRRVMLVAQWGDGGPQVENGVISTVVTLRRIGDPRALDHLRSELDTWGAHPRIVMAVAEALAQFKDAAAIPALAQAPAMRDATARTAIVKALLEIGVTAFGELPADIGADDADRLDALASRATDPAYRAALEHTARMLRASGNTG